MRRYHWTYLVLICLFYSACATNERSSSILSFHSVAAKLISTTPDLEHFFKEGPFSYEVRHNFVIRVNADEVLHSDLYLSEQSGKAPLLIFQHGNKANKDVHAEQARRAASWGFHAMVIEQPNHSRWILNGLVLADLVRMLYRWPNLLNSQFDRDRIILIGHSFGGSAVSIAAGSDCPVAGVILLDPALVSSAVQRYFEQIHVPVVLLGADPQIFQSRRRSSFYKMIQTDMIEVSVAGSTHNDAQYPNMFRWQQILGLEPEPKQELQEVFASAIVASSFSIASTHSTFYAWQAFRTHRDRFAKIQRK
ncbi:MAG: alpha/beta fold hydrolase [Oligoflexus sp.]